MSAPHANSKLGARANSYSARIWYARGKELNVPCYAFEQDELGNWIATEPLSMNTPVGMLEIMPWHPVSVLVANILNARCP